jgi:hypothetical protein
MTTLNKKEEKGLDKLLLLKQLQQRLEAEEFIEDVRDAEDKEQIEFKDVEELEIFYEDYIDNLKFQAEGLQAESQQAIDKFKQKFNIEEEV